MKVRNKLSDNFSFNAGVRQGDGLSAVLFNLALHTVVDAVNQGGTIFEKSSQICAFADDIAIVTRGKQTMNQIYEILKREAARVGLKVNIDKTKYLVMSDRTVQDLRIGTDSFRGVSSFSYLGTLLTADNNLRKCIQERINAGNKAYFANIQLFGSRLISRNLKLKLYLTLVRPVVTYGSETWTLTVGDERLLGAFERRILRRVYGPINENGDWRIRYNQEIDALIDGKTIVRFIKAQRIRWLGHVERMAASEIPKRMLRGRLYNRRRRSRP